MLNSKSLVSIYIIFSACFIILVVKLKKKNFLIALMTYVNQFFVEDSVMISIIVWTHQFISSNSSK